MVGPITATPVETDIYVDSESLQRQHRAAHAHLAQRTIELAGQTVPDVETSIVFVCRRASEIIPFTNGTSD